MTDGGRTALLSVWNKDGLEDLARGLDSAGWTICASGGTARAVSGFGIDVMPTEELTGIDSILGGRVKTLHPELHAAILAAGSDRQKREDRGEIVFDLVAVDPYPFHKAADLNPDDPELVELIDIGGPTMVRGAAKNWRHVIPAFGADVFPLVLNAILSGEDDEVFRRRMAARTFDLTSRYDAEVSMALEKDLVPQLRYGENPHQKAAVHFNWPMRGFALADVYQDKSLSYNNYMDASAAWDLSVEMPADRPSAVLMKHGNPCGAGCGTTPLEAFRNAFRADRTSPYGGILAMNCPVDMELVAGLKGLFLELVMAPDYEDGALSRLLRRKKLRVIRMPEGMNTDREQRSIWGGLLIQQSDCVAGLEKLEVVSVRKPTEDELCAMDLMWRVCRSVKSNAIVIGDAHGTLGVGAGQMSRIESLDLALRRAKREGHSLKGAVLASDGFFPFSDGPEMAAAEGISAIVQPGGSIRDEEVIEAADSSGMAMVFTSTRHFRH